ncbi:NAB [Mytilus edulis]|uniref:NAB n=1 Tax=Mytilus edulis TaxID=6550 RepID=A0A8S3SXH1_MYTED|nr:NAB [Mytilus edulis]
MPRIGRRRNGNGRARVPVVEAQPPERRRGRRNRAVAAPGIQDVGAVVGEVQAPLPLPIQAPLSIERQPALQGPQLISKTVIKQRQHTNSDKIEETGYLLIRMASIQPQNLIEWQLHCVLKRASLLQYYDSFIRQGESDVLQLSEADDNKFKDVMEKVGMAKKSIHVRQFKNTLLEWVKDPGKDSIVPSYITTDRDSRMPPAPKSLNLQTATLSRPDKTSVVQKLPKCTQGNPTKDKDQLTSDKSEKKELLKQPYTTQYQTHSEVKDQKHHEHHDLTRYYDELLDNTVLDKMVLDNLISRCILMIEDREEIIKPTTQRERNKVLLDILSERPYPTFQLFKDVLQESEPSNSYVQEIVRKMTSTESRDEHISYQGQEIGK